MSNYPNDIDDETSIPLVDNSTTISADAINRLRNAIIAVEAELGINPSGTHGTVSDRINALENTLSVGSVAASTISIIDADGYYVSPNVEGAVQEIGAALATSVSAASDVSIIDSGGYYSSGNVEGALAAIGAESAKSNASQLNVIDADGYFYALNVEDALAELGKMQFNFLTGEIASPSDGRYTLLLNAPFGMRLISSDIICDSGVADGYFEIDDNVTGSQFYITNSNTNITFSIDDIIYPGSKFSLSIINNLATNIKFCVIYVKDNSVRPAVVDGFEFGGGWPNTVINPYPSPLFSTATLNDSFDNSDGWPGT